jgi:hypothetical protein
LIQAGRAFKQRALHQRNLCNILVLMDGRFLGIGTFGQEGRFQESAKAFPDHEDDAGEGRAEHLKCKEPGARVNICVSGLGKCAEDC